jgi:hypothetical protein
MSNSISTWSLKDFNIFLNLITKSCSMSTLELAIVWFTRRWEKFTWLCLCESPYDLGARFAFCLQGPNIFSPSICVILIVQAEPEECFKITFASCFESLDWIALHKNSSLLLGPWHGQPPYLKWKYNVNCLKTRT